MPKVRLASPGVREAIFATLSRDRGVTKEVATVARKVRDEARRNAPKDTGTGAKSIKVERHWDSRTRRVTYRVSWDRSHFYMGFHEFGTLTLPARPFLRPAADAYGGREPQGGG